MDLSKASWRGWQTSCLPAATISGAWLAAVLTIRGVRPTAMGVQTHCQAERFCWKCIAPKVQGWHPSLSGPERTSASQGSSYQLREGEGWRVSLVTDALRRSGPGSWDPHRRTPHSLDGEHIAVTRAVARRHTLR